LSARHNGALKRAKRHVVRPILRPILLGGDLGYNFVLLAPPHKGDGAVIGIAQEASLCN
jgi:hypothetical protein